MPCVSDEQCSRGPVRGRPPRPRSIFPGAHERGEHADRVAAADAGRHHIGVGPPVASPNWGRASSPITRWRSRTSTGERVRPHDGADDVVGRPTDAAQSRSASFTASLRVLEPAVTGTTSAPRSFIRDTFGACRRVSSSPMYTTREPEQCACGRGRDAVHAGAGLGDDPPSRAASRATPVRGRC